MTFKTTIAIIFGVFVSLLASNVLNSFFMYGRVDDNPECHYVS